MTNRLKKIIKINAFTGDSKLLELLNESFNGRVSSVFKRSFNLKVSKGSKEELITFIDKSTGFIPLGITLDIGDISGFNKIGLKAGMESRIRNSEILIDNVLSIDIRNCLWRNTVIAVRPINAAFLEKNLKAVKSILKKRQSNYGLIHLINHIEEIIENKKKNISDMNLMCKKSYAILADFFKEINDGEFYCALETILRLVGLGFGTTPSGDDILLGIIASFNYFYSENNRYLPNKNFLEFKEKLKKAIYGKTTIISEKYLIQAIDGNISEKLSNYMNSILFGKSQKILQKAVYSLMSFGSTSGSEIILGSLLALKFYLHLNHTDERRELGYELKKSTG